MTSATPCPARPRPRVGPADLALGCLAGFLAVLVFHQLTIGAMHLAGLVANAPYPLDPTRPLGAPRVISLAFWGGVWAVVLVVLRPALPRAPMAFLAVGFVFGVVGPAFFGWFVLSPLRGQAVAQGWNLVALARGAFINGMFGLGSAAFLLLADRLRGRS